MTRIKSRTLVTALLATALAVVAVLTAQASRSTTDLPARARAAAAAARAPHNAGPPVNSGNGERVVYSISRGRVWLVDRNDRVVRTFPVVEGEVAPSVGTHRVFARRLGGTGGDGARVEHVVLFAVTDDTNVGFSAPSDGSPQPPDPAKPTAAIRETRADGDVMWQLAMTGTTVVVVW